MGRRHRAVSDSFSVVDIDFPANRGSTMSDVALSRHAWRVGICPLLTSRPAIAAITDHPIPACRIVAVTLPPARSASREPQFFEKLAGQSAIRPRRCLYASPLIG